MNSVYRYLAAAIILPACLYLIAQAMVGVVVVWVGK